MSQELQDIEVRIERLERRCQEAERRFRVQGVLAILAVIGAILLSPSNRAAIAQGYGVTLATLNTRVIALEQKTQYLSVTGGEMYVTGTNLHIVNGLGATNGYPTDPSTISSSLVKVNGKGNLIIGYNASLNSGAHTGSHNLVIGDYLNYSSYGAIVAGWDNASRNPFASTLGGRSNLAMAEWSVIVGGAFNTTDGSTASILGGDANRASAIDATVCGGNGNSALGRFSVVGGGGGRSATGEFDWVAGALGQDF